jgi:ketopantoate reductase
MLMLVAGGISGTECNPNRLVNVHRALRRALYTGLQGAAEGSVPDLAEKLEQFVVDAAVKNANNYSSMYQDAAAGRPTEVGYINGTVVKIAEEHGLPVPCNQLLLQQVRMLETLGGFG